MRTPEAQRNIRGHLDQTMQDSLRVLESAVGQDEVHHVEAGLPSRNKPRSLQGTEKVEHCAHGVHHGHTAEGNRQFRCSMWRFREGVDRRNEGKDTERGTVIWKAYPYHGHTGVVHEEIYQATHEDKAKQG